MSVTNLVKKTRQQKQWVDRVLEKNLKKGGGGGGGVSNKGSLHKIGGSPLPTILILPGYFNTLLLLWSIKL